MKKYLLFLSRQLRNSSQQVKDLLNTEPSLSFDSSSGSFSITNQSLTWDQKISLRRSLMNKLREIKPLASIKIDEIVTGYYDYCLERYLFERINRSLPNDDTCWLKFAQNNKCIGWVNPQLPFDKTGKTSFLEELSRKKGYYKDKSLVNALERDKEGYVHLRSNHIYTADDKILELCARINGQGFSNIISSLTPVILGQSIKTGRYGVISGRHRIAVLRYLRSQGKIKRNIGIKCHLVKYPFESLTYTRPFTTDCKQCDWGRIFDPGTGTHQDFYVREGIAVMRGHPKRKGGKQKWNCITPVFRNMVQHKKVLDVGAHRGLYCLKALEYGAKQVTALEPNVELADMIDAIRVRYAFGDLNIIRGDFYNDDDYRTLVANKYDTVFLFGIIHHLLRLGIQKEILYTFDELFQRISIIANYGIFVEFAMPRESSLILPEIEPHREAFSREAFERAIHKYFPQNKNLGGCNYRSGNKYGRFMYYGIKQ